MKEKQYTRPLTIVLQEALYEQVKQETDEAKISLSEWFREAATLKINQDKEERKDGQRKQT